ncbi:MAG: AsmA family protein [Terriglobales bacterium]
MAVIAGLLVVLFVFRPGVQRLRNRIAGSIGAALGRNVAIEDVRFRILPRPGFDLEGFVISDDPAFSAEPMIRAQDVFAAIRFRSLLRGRLEIATLSATEPSINIVRNNEGRWNLASLLERNAQIPAAPTQKPISERRPGFPYLEASNARINFKIGQEKKSYALTDADVALWQDSENSWGARMKAQPVRTDFNLTDTGQLQVNATWQRAPNLDLTPLRLSIAWEKGQLGQITTLLTGADRGWRGGVDFTANLSGTPEALTVESRAAVNGFRRYDILDNRIVNLTANCKGKYNASSRSFADLLCESPVGGGMLRVRGNVVATTGRPSYDLTLAAEKVPFASVLGLIHEAKQQLPADLTAEGLLNAEFHAVGDGLGPSQLSGTGAASDVNLISSAGSEVVAIGNIPLALIGDSRCCKAARSAQTASARISAQGTDGKEPEPVEAHLRVGPVALKVNASAPLNAGGWISAGGYRFFLRGDVELKNLFRLEHTLGLPAARPAAEGDAKLDVSISGTWHGLAAPTAFGTAQLRNVRAETRGLNAPIEISSATVLLAADAFSLQKLSAQTGSTHWSGSVTAPRHCAPACLFQFDLTADQFSTGDLVEWFTPHPAKRPWYRILSSTDQQGPSPLLALQAQGSLHVGHLGLKKLLATQVSTQLAVDRGKIALTALHGQLLQGIHQGNWTIDTTALPPRYHGTGALQNISLGQLVALMNEAWIAGSGDGSFELETSGGNFGDLLAHADGKLNFVMRNGRLNHVQISSAEGPLPVHRFTGDLRLKKGVWELSGGRLESRDGIYRVSGTDSPTAGLDVMLTRDDDQSWNLTGTLTKPHVAPVNQEISRTPANTKSESKR